MPEGTCQAVVQPGFAIWLMGLPSSGKTSRGYALSRLLAERGIGVQLLDSDDLRRKLTPNPIYSDEERADKGEIATLPGAGVPYEPPEYPEARVDTSHLLTEEAARRILDQLDEWAFFDGWRSPHSLIRTAGFDAELSRTAQSVHYLDHETA